MIALLMAAAAALILALAGTPLLIRVLRAKGGPSEARYVRLLNGHARLRRSLEALVASAPALMGND